MINADGTGLRYFDPEPSFHYELSLERAASGPSEEIQTSTGDVQQLFRAGTLRFVLTGAPGDVVVEAVSSGVAREVVEACWK